jgi:hypothetical protein
MAEELYSAITFLNYTDTTPWVKLNFNRIVELPPGLPWSQEAVFELAAGIKDKDFTFMPVKNV